MRPGRTNNRFLFLSLLLFLCFDFPHSTSIWFWYLPLSPSVIWRNYLTLLPLPIGMCVHSFGRIEIEFKRSFKILSNARRSFKIQHFLWCERALMRSWMDSEVARRQTASPLSLPHFLTFILLSKENVKPSNGLWRRILKISNFTDGTQTTWPRILTIRPTLSRCHFHNVMIRLWRRIIIFLSNHCQLCDRVSVPGNYVDVDVDVSGLNHHHHRIQFKLSIR